ncbi:3'-5' exonuclease [Campylobacter pinnipediorum]|uniref:3'-5' exonuclease n=1 Tax=Campylobacter pinnipediorum subsp. pinnipediorum TaxID=1660067 RepID=A0AAX0LAX2_9BACT|nr:3'-5' exonuclease [Campylobacter pinnipediorum]AQW81736.1 putative polysaccharide biosynthesis protein [Campylobacter pinnipediorum subsp. pinnipediorum]AQW83412.1 putative polysaccharide biosynthesis protein [Campylobacter pinnipediorum subsp. pinnipediorum]OPA79784.1 3'-5' exonuclease [Campylobacter pinnipediorum subsp. pinnipediorum]OPA81611.1 3'-5' exonuclease [Campylobacter pinnipediorum subsp. pinnipediorum]
MAKNCICVFDCETIPDVDLLRRVYGFDGDDMDVSLQAFEYQKSISGSEFLPVMFHKVVAISAVIADEYGKFERVNTMEGEDERDILSKFINFINRLNPRLVSFNGRGFDLPMIMTRAMRYNLTANAYYETDNKELNKNKWENYRSRYDARFHLDLLDHISDFGAVRGLKLDLLCASLNLPGKYDVHGDQVLQLYYENEIFKINEYCESDVLNTYWLFLKFELLQGHVTLDDYAHFLNTMSNFLNTNCKNKNYTDIFCDFISQELYRLQNKDGYKYISKINKTAFDEDIQRVSLENLDEHMAKNGLENVLKKASELKPSNAKIKIDEQIPEINLDDE